MKRFRFDCFIAFMVIFFLSCEDFQEEDISDIKITLKAPSNQLTTSLRTITFWWDSTENVKKYNLQIVKSSFLSLEEVVLDTTMFKTKIRKTLAAGKYEWRVCGLNGSSKAYSDTFELSIQ